MIISMRRRGATGMADGTSHFFGFDPQSNTRLLSNPVRQVSDTYSYKGFGGQLSASGTTSNPHRFGGKVGYYSDKPSRVYVRARHYQPQTGRWLSRDPIGFVGGGWNLYRYVENNAVSKFDPSGLASYCKVAGCRGWNFGIGIRPVNSPVRPYTPGYNTVTPTAGDRAAAVAIKNPLGKAARYAYCYALTRSATTCGLYTDIWLSNTGAEQTVDLSRILAVSALSRSDCQRQLRCAARFAEDRLKAGERRTIKGCYVGSGILVNEHTDFFWAVGGYSAWGRALVTTNDCRTFRMQFTYTLEDIFTLTKFGRPFGSWHLKGLAKDFWVTSILSKSYTWVRGQSGSLKC